MAKPTWFSQTGRAIDAALSVVAPKAAAQRLVQRQAFARAYEAASTTDGWRPRRPQASANADMLADALPVRTKARALVQNVPYIAQGLRSRVNNTIGTGIITRSKAPEAIAQKIEAAWAAWQRVCDADGRLNWAAFQAAAHRAMLQDGEVLIRLRPRRTSDNLPAPLQLQLLEIDWLDTLKNATTTNSGGSIINGIQYLSLIHISEPTRPCGTSRMPSSA